MSNKPEIVGIVHRLQRDLKYLAPKDGFSDRRKEMEPEIAAAFPAIAEALTIALTALEKIEANAQRDDEGYSEIAGEALSRIRSLP